MTPRLFDLPDLPDDEPDAFEDLPPDPVSESQSRAGRAGKEFDHDAFAFVEKAGGTIVERYPKVAGYQLDALIEGANGRRFLLAAHGTPDPSDLPKAGLRRDETVLKAGFRAMRLAPRNVPPLILLTSHLPKPGSNAAFLLAELADSVWDVVATTGDLGGFQRLRAVLTEPTDGGDDKSPPPHAPWRARQLGLDDVLDLEGDE